MENKTIFDRKISRRRFMQAAALGAMSTAIAGGSASAQAAGTSAGSASQTAVIEAFDWGPAVTATIIKLPCVVQPASVRAADFTVEETKEAAGNTVSSTAREVTDAYTCSKSGKRISVPSSYIRLDMSYGPKTGKPFVYNRSTGKNTWCSPYELSVALAENAELKNVLGCKVSSLTVDPVIDLASAKIDPLEKFDMSGTFAGSDGRSLCYAWYKPVGTFGKKLPLVIWLHGGGEGGSDPSIALLGNKVTTLAGDAFQDAMGGAAYVLVPQTSTLWLDWNSSGSSSWEANPGAPSIYTETLMELIENFVAQHPAIDTDRIYIGGCSNGGYMTMNMVLRHPDYFAAAYPICEAYMNSGISDAEINSIKNVPLWFVYAQNDTTVDPTIYEKPTIERLKAIGANIKTSIFADVHDTSGKYSGADGAPYQYSGHWSWLYFFNNQCVDDTTGESMWTWMAQQHK